MPRRRGLAGSASRIIRLRRPFHRSFAAFLLKPLGERFLALSGLTSALHRADFDARGDAIMWVTPGTATGHGSGAALQAAIRKLQGLQVDLAQLLRLRKREAEYQARCRTIVSCPIVTWWVVCCEASCASIASYAHVQARDLAILRYACVVGGVRAGRLSIRTPS